MTFVSGKRLFLDEEAPHRIALQLCFSLFLQEPLRRAVGGRCRQSAADARYPVLGTRCHTEEPRPAPCRGPFKAAPRSHPRRWEAESRGVQSCDRPRARQPGPPALPPAAGRTAQGRGRPPARGRSASPRPPRRRLGGTRAAAAELRRPRAGRRAAPGKLGAEARAPLPPRPAGGRRSAPRSAWTASRCCRSGRPPTAPPRRARATTTGRATTAPSPPRSPASSRPRRTLTRAPRPPQVGARRGRHGGAGRGREPREGPRAVAGAVYRLRAPGSGCAASPRKYERAETTRRDSRRTLPSVVFFGPPSVPLEGCGSVPHGVGESRQERAALRSPRARGGSYRASRRPPAVWGGWRPCFAAPNCGERPVGNAVRDESEPGRLSRDRLRWGKCVSTCGCACPSRRIALISSFLALVW